VEKRESSSRAENREHAEVSSKPARASSNASGSSGTAPVRARLLRKEIRPTPRIRIALQPARRRLGEQHVERRLTIRAVR